MIVPLLSRTIVRSKDETLFSEYFHFSINVECKTAKQTGRVLLFTAGVAQMQFCQLSCAVTARKEAQNGAPEQVGHGQAVRVWILLPCFHPVKHLDQVKPQIAQRPPRRPVVVAVAVPSSIWNEVASEFERIENLWEGAICGF